MATLAKLLVELGMDSEGFKTGLTETAGKLESVSKKVTKVGAGMTAGLTAPMMAVGAIALSAAGDYDNALDMIAVATGATGAELDVLGQMTRDIFTTIPTDMETAATAISELANRTDATGESLKELATAEIELARITGTDLSANIQSTTQMFEKWGIAVDQQVPSLDMLFRTSQATGIGVDKLSASMVQHGATLQALGFDYTTALAILGSFEKAGINTTQAMAGLKTALAKMAEEGVTDASAALTTLVDKIKAAPTDMEATAIAIDYFGQRAGPELSKAIRNGTLDVADLIDTIKNGGPGIIETAQATNDYAENLQIAKNRAMDALVPIGTLLFDAITKLSPKIVEGAEVIQRLVEGFSELPGPAQAIIGGFVGLLAAAGPVLMVLGSVVTIAPAVGAAFTIMTGPVGLVIAALALLFVAYQTNFLGFADGVNWALDKVKEGFDATLPYIQAVADLLSSAFTAALPILTEAFDLIVTHISETFANVKQILTGYVTIIKGVMQVIKGIFTLDWGLIKTGVTTIVTGMKDVVGGILNQLMTNVKFLLGAVKMVFSLAWNAIKDKAVDVVQGTADKVVEILDGLVSLVWNSAFNAGYAIGNGIIGGINAIWNSVIGFAGDLVDAVLDKLKDVPGFSPIEHVGQFYGAKLGEGFGEGIASAEYAVGKAASGLTGAAANGMSTNYNGGITINVSGAGDPNAVADRVFSRFVREMALTTGGV